MKLCKFDYTTIKNMIFRGFMKKTIVFLLFLACFKGLQGMEGQPRDYYTILGVERTANQESIKEKYRALAKQYHPSKNLYGGEIFKEINNAHDVLRDPEKRNFYDKYGDHWKRYYDLHNRDNVAQKVAFEDILHKRDAYQTKIRSIFSMQPDINVLKPEIDAANELYRQYIMNNNDDDCCKALRVNFLENCLQFAQLLYERDCIDEAKCYIANGLRYVGSETDFADRLKNLYALYVQKNNTPAVHATYAQSREKRLIEEAMKKHAPPVKKRKIVDPKNVKATIEAVQEANADLRRETELAKTQKIDPLFFHEKFKNVANKYYISERSSELRVNPNFLEAKKEFLRLAFNAAEMLYQKHENQPDFLFFVQSAYELCGEVLKHVSSFQSEEDKVWQLEVEKAQGNIKNILMGWYNDLGYLNFSFANSTMPLDFVHKGLLLFCKHVMEFKLTYLNDYVFKFSYLLAERLAKNKKFNEAMRIIQNLCRSSYAASNDEFKKKCFQLQNIIRLEGKNDIDTKNRNYVDVQDRIKNANSCLITLQIALSMDKEKGFYSQKIDNYHNRIKALIDQYRFNPSIKFVDTMKNFLEIPLDLQYEAFDNCFKFFTTLYNNGIINGAHDLLEYVCGVKWSEPSALQRIEAVHLYRFVSSTANEVLKKLEVLQTSVHVMRCSNKTISYVQSALLAEQQHFIRLISNLEPHYRNGLEQEIIGFYLNFARELLQENRYDNAIQVIDAALTTYQTGILTEKLNAIKVQAQLAQDLSNQEGLSEQDTQDILGDVIDLSL